MHIWLTLSHDSTRETTVWILMKFGVDIVPLEATSKLILLLHFLLVLFSMISNANMVGEQTSEVGSALDPINVGS
jgi:hypothetical protein